MTLAFETDPRPEKALRRRTSLMSIGRFDTYMFVELVGFGIIICVGSCRDDEDEGDDDEGSGAGTHSAPPIVLLLLFNSLRIGAAKEKV